MQDPADREFRLTFWKLHVLHHAAEGPVYGLWMLQELASHGHEVSPGTLYPLLARMEAHGWLRADPTATSKARKNYRITASGRRLLHTLRREIAELHRELVPDAELERAASPRKRAHKKARKR